MPRWRRKIPVSLLLTLLVVVILILSYVFGVSSIQARGSSLFEPADLYLPRLIDVVIFGWLFWIGSAIGSFLNVVAWRMPRGESINGRSYCPRCQTQLRARDNFPVFGWLALQGRCRTCRLPISARYPIIEATVGTSLTLVGISQLYRLSLPNQYVHWHGGPFWAPVVDTPMLLTLLYHAFAVSVAWAIGLIRMDGHRLPTRLTIFAMAVAILPMLAYPVLMVVPWQTTVDARWLPDERYLDALLRIITALAAAVVLGRFLARGLCPGADPKLDPLGEPAARLIDLIVILLVPTIVVGWQAAPAVLLLAAVLAVTLRSWLPSSVDALGRLAIAMPVALTFQLVFWRHLHSLGVWPSVGSSPWVILASIGLLLPIPWWLKEATKPTSNQEADRTLGDDNADSGDNEPLGQTAAEEP